MSGTLFAPLFCSSIKYKVIKTPFWCYFACKYSIIIKRIGAGTAPSYDAIWDHIGLFFSGYCDSHIGLFFIAPCKVITLNPLIILFGISSLLFIMVLFLKLSLFLALKGDSKKITSTFCKRL